MTYGKLIYTPKKVTDDNQILWSQAFDYMTVYMTPDKMLSASRWFRDLSFDVALQAYSGRYFILDDEFISFLEMYVSVWTPLIDFRTMEPSYEEGYTFACRDEAHFPVLRLKL